ncbi:hypothetical protein G9A89_011573 [Geosiphon pyriformis]|nr:hypothetical protein G9A89_011573 [Geosiphon pyriformis]
MAMIRSTLWQPNSITTHVLLNALEDQNKLKNRTMNYVWLVKKLSQTKECGITFLDEEECAMKCVKEEELISSCVLELRSTFNSNSNFDNDDDENNGSSFAQLDKKNNGNSDSNSNPKTYIALPDLFKEQELRWYSNNNESIMPECVHDTNVGFDLKYPGKDLIKLEPYSCTCIDLKIALKIPATTIV